MGEQEPEVKITREAMIGFRDDLRSRFSRLLDSPDPEAQHDTFFIKAIIQCLDDMIASDSAPSGEQQGPTDQAQYQALLSKTVFQVQQDPLESLPLPARPSLASRRKPAERRNENWLVI